MSQLPLPIGSYKLPAPSASTRRLVNCFAEEAPSDKPKQPALLRRAPGIRSFAELTVMSVDAGPVRGSIVMADVLYVLAGSTVFSVDDAGTGTALTGSVPGNVRVKMATNGFDIVIVRPDNGLAYSSDGATVAQITDPVFLGFGGVGDVQFLDGYFVFRVLNTARFFNSGLNALTFNALDVATAEAAPDNLLGLFVDHREIFLPGSASSELWYNAGNSPGSPFSRSPNGFLTIGTAASDSIGAQDNSIFWLANDLTIRRLNGMTPVRVSNHGIEAILQRLERVDDAFCFTYSQEGHLFIGWTFLFSARTLIFDCTTNEWAERDSIIATVSLGYWRPSVCIQAYGLQLVGDSQSGKLGVLDPDTHEEWGEPQQVSWTYQGIYADRRKVSLRRFELVFNPGKGLLTGQGENPLATLKLSIDGGEEYKTRPTRSLGRRGNYTARAVWWNNGSSRDFVARVDVTDPIPLFIIDTEIEVEGGRL